MNSSAMNQTLKSHSWLPILTLMKLQIAGVIHAERFGKRYHFSWLEAGPNTNWEGARNYCRKFCMDSISIETKNENDWVKNIIRKDDIHYIWTGGRKCKKSILNPYCTAKPNTQAWESLTYK